MLRGTMTFVGTQEGNRWRMVTRNPFRSMTLVGIYRGIKSEVVGLLRRSARLGI